MNKVAIIVLSNELTAQLEALRNNESIDEIVIIPISVDYADDMQKVCIKLRDERYFLAYATEPTKPLSVLWSNLNFIRANFGLERYSDKPFNELSRVTSPVTDISLNYGRKQNIADNQKAIELNVHYNELSNLQPDGTFGTFKSKDEYGREIIVQRVPNKLTKACKTAYEKDIAKGLFVVCKFVGEVDLAFG